MSVGAGDHLPGLLAYTASSPIPVTTAADHRATRVQAKQRRSVRDLPRESTVALSDLALFNCFNISSNPRFSCKLAALLQAQATLRLVATAFAEARPTS